MTQQDKSSPTTPPEQQGVGGSSLTATQMAIAGGVRQTCEEQTRGTKSHPAFISVMLEANLALSKMTDKELASALGLADWQFENLKTGKTPTASYS